jgi:hypothetical protein
MHFEPSATPAECRALVSRFAAIAGWSNLSKRFGWLVQQKRDNPLVGQYLSERFSLELALEQIFRHRQVTGRLPGLPLQYADHSLYGAYALAAMVARIHHRLSDRGQTRLAGMLQDGLKSDNGLAPLAFEMAIASHLLARAFDIECVDLEGTGRFDFLAARAGVELEVECKNVTGDLGRQIHRRRLYQLSGHIHRHLRAGADRGGGHLLEVVVPTRLHGETSTMLSIAHAVATSISTAAPYANDCCSVGYSAFDIHGTPAEADPASFDEQKARVFVEQRFQIENPHAFFLFRPGRGVVVLVLSSAKKDVVLGGLHRQLSTGAEQFTGTRPAALCVRLSDVFEHDLTTLAESAEVSGIQRLTNYLLQTPKRAHLHTLAYAAPGKIVAQERKIGGDTLRHSLHESGLAWFFVNPNHPQAADNRYSVFN